MSINNSYFSKNNTIISNSLTNTGQNPVTELFYGSTASLQFPNGYSRFIFDIDLTLLKEKINNGTISINQACSSVKHTLRMTNTSSFDKELLNTTTSQGRMRATSFDLILFRIPTVYDTTDPQIWDEGVGYDFADLIYDYSNFDKNFSDRPSNWSGTTTITNWSEPGIYNNKNTGIFNFNDLVIVDTQHFQFGDENISFNMTNEINYLLTGNTSNYSGWGIAYKPQVENLTGLTSNYEVQFFTRHTQTFYEPFLETTYNDLIEDDRNSFSQGRVNRLFLYLYDNGLPFNLDNNPLVDIIDSNDVVLFSGLSTCRITKGIYEVRIPAIIGYNNLCTFTDKWYQLTSNGFIIPQVFNEFTVYPLSKTLQIGTNSQDPKLYGFDYYGIKQDEKVYNTDIRKVGVIIKQAFSTNKMLRPVTAYYRIFVREGQTEVQVQDWTKINRTPNEYYFMFDTRDKIPNEYYIDIKVESSGEVNTYKRQIKFQIVNVKYSE
jgi:hypothetical protein